jgi:hypothetical protein
MKGKLKIKKILKSKKLKKKHNVPKISKNGEVIRQFEIK